MRQAGNLDVQRGLCGDLSCDIVYPERAALQVERHLAVACFAAAPRESARSGLDFAAIQCWV